MTTNSTLTLLYGFTILLLCDYTILRFYLRDELLGYEPVEQDELEGDHHYDPDDARELRGEEGKKVQLERAGEGERRLGV